MSRVGKQIIDIPQGTDVRVEDMAVVVKGKGGELRRSLHPRVSVELGDNTVQVHPKSSSNTDRALWGTFASHIQNMVRGVNEPFEKKLIVEGVGYKVALTGDTLTLNVGFSHPVDMTVPKDVSVTVEKNEITVSGADKETVGQFAAEVRAVKKPEPYKGKGIRYSDEIVRRKQGKKAVA